MLKKTYTAWCHVGDHLHTLETEFFSSGTGKQIGTTVYPVLACREHNDRAKVREAFLRLTGQTEEEAKAIPGNGLAF